MSRCDTTLVPAVLEQKVVGVEARRAWRYLLLHFGGPGPRASPGRDAGVPARAGLAPHPLVGVAPGGRWKESGPAPSSVRPRWRPGWKRSWPCPRMGPTRPAAVAGRDRGLDFWGLGTPAGLRGRGRGVRGRLSHLPSAVGWALAGRVVDDAGMLDLLAPYAGHRHRAARLVELGGIRLLRRGPACPCATTAPSDAPLPDAAPRTPAALPPA